MYVENERKRVHSLSLSRLIRLSNALQVFFFWLFFCMYVEKEKERERERERRSPHPPFQRAPGYFFFLVIFFLVNFFACM